MFRCGVYTVLSQVKCWDLFGIMESSKFRCQHLFQEPESAIPGPLPLF